jgi:peptidoglycan biosynthesis protein MviN/MurJ (putative lipid II flippase)
LIVGVVAGTFLQVLVLLLLTNFHTHTIGSFSLQRSSGEWQNIRRDLLTLLGAQTLITFALPYDNAFASMAGEGGIATYGYAVRLLGLFISFGSVVFGRAILPVLSDVAVSGERQRGSSLAHKWSALLFLLGILVAGAAWVVAPVIVRLAFQRGAFTAADASAVTRILQYGLLQVPFVFGALTAVQWFAAQRRYGTILLATAVAAVAKLVSNPLLYPVLGLPGLALATAAMYACSMSVMLFSLQRAHRALA